jgi:glutathione S-transferase
MAKFTVYGTNMNRGARVTWCMRELGQDFTLVENGPGSPNNAITYDAKANPNKTVPVLVCEEGGQKFTCYESFAITNYLVKKLNSPMAPKTPEEDAKIAQWSMWALTTIEGPSLQKLMKGPGDHDAALAGPMAALNIELAGKEYLVGDRFTVADLNVGHIVGNWTMGAKFDLGPYPNVSAWANRLRERPNFRPPKKAKM